MLQLTVRADGNRPSASAGRHVNRWRDHDGQTFAQAFATPSHYQLDWSHLGVFEFAPPDSVVTLDALPGVSAAHAHDLFETTIQPLLLPAYGVQTLHASAAATPEGVVVFAGLGGSGKSTTAYALGREPDCTQIADDAVAFDVTKGGRPVVRPLPFRPKLRPASQAHFASSNAVIRAPEMRSTPAILALVIQQQQPGLEPFDLARISAAEAFARVVPHAHVFDPEDVAAKAQFVAAYLALVSAVPVYSLRYTPRFDQLSTMLAALRELPGAVAVAGA